ncbi:MAG: hypothetical protein JWM18_4179 [Chloroflexi bacterium]|nr:hypothetical protein [Chloroflexota bacterium]MEA2614565.1 hypothetical protein [Chloroflexota bacterium]
MAERVRRGERSNGAASDRPQPFPSYEELASDLLEALDETGLSIEDVRHELEPGAGERRFDCTVRLQPSEPPSRYHAHLSFVWDALMTYVAAYGPGADCDLYHDDEEQEDCPHRRLQPQPFVEIEAEFVLGDGGYELQELGEVAGWLDTVQTLLGKAFPTDDRPSVHVGLAALGGSVLVEKLTAEHSWLIDFDEPPDFSAMAAQVLEALRLVPQLADRLPM